MGNTQICRSDPTGIKSDPTGTHLTDNILKDQIVTFEKEKSESSSEEKIEAQDTLKMI